ncbi:MAG: DUF3352 domain-containing protein [Ardenticatenaceae bacterium]|nr:DUF3352 domain-containing protein [Anaerolineales bacterium]MCB8941045.1 DUF3352 domain-containing protein [Ardenticatenaceae bacterium]MCB8972386.1 DUF3352 domain-containing protein [Ardenticatenaceae bacterium]
MSEQIPVNSTPETSGGGGNRMLIIGGLVGLAAVAVLVIGAIVLIPRLLGADENAIAGVMPPETSLLVELNALNLASEDASRVARAFEDVLAEGDVEFDGDDPASLLETLDADLDDATGLTITDDVLPWIGTNMGIGLIELDIEAFDQGEMPQIIFAATIRDIDAADVFIEDLVDVIEDESGNKVDDVEYGGALVFEVDSDFEDERIAFGRSSEIFFITTNMDTMEEAIDAQNGENLGDIAEYQDTVAELPGDRAITIYVSSQGIEDTANGLEDSGEVDGFDANTIEDLGLTGVGMAATIIPEGIRVDFVGNYESLTEEQQEMMDAQSDKSETAEFLPESTYVFLIGHRLDLIWQSSIASLEASGISEDDFDEAMDMFDDMFGFNPNDDLLPLLNGEFSLAIIDSDEGPIAEEFNTDLGAVLMLGSSEGEELVGLMEDFTDGLEDQDLSVDDTANDDVTIYEVEDPGGVLIGAYGLSEDYLVAATSGESIENLFAGEANLADSDKYKNAWDAFPRGTIPVMYMDLQGLFTALEDVDPTMKEVVDVNPVYAFAMGTNSSKNSTQSTMIFFIAGE